MPMSIELMIALTILLNGMSELAYHEFNYGCALRYDRLEHILAGRIKCMHYLAIVLKIIETSSLKML